MKKTAIFFLLVSIGITALYSCQQQNKTEIDDAPEQRQNGDVILSNDKIKRAGIYFGTIEKALLSYDVNARGQVIVPPQNKALVSVMIGGIIREIFVDPGQKVKKGQLLATYSHPDFVRIQQNFITLKNRFALVEKQYERQKKLVVQKIKSEKEFQETEAEYYQALSELKAAEAELDLLDVDKEQLAKGNISSQVQIKSPIPGVIDKINASIGMFADMQQPLFEVINMDKLMLQVKVFEKDIAQIQPGQRVTFTLSDDQSDENEGYITNVGSTVDPQGRVITVLTTIKTSGLNLIPGMFVSSKIHTSEQMLDALPETAIIIDNDEETYGFYTLDDPDAASLAFHKFNVKTGFTEDKKVHVIPVQPLPENALVAMDGVYYLKSEMLKSLDD